ncbi:hypothetical protein PAGU2595_028400 [Lysobacter xanthus]
MTLRPYETVKLARLRRVYILAVCVAFGGWLGAFALGQLGYPRIGEWFMYPFGVGGLVAALACIIYGVLVLPRWCRYVWGRLRVFRSGA